MKKHTYVSLIVLIALSFSLKSDNNFTFKISNNSLFKMTSDGFKSTEIESWRKNMNIFYSKGKYYFSDSKIDLKEIDGGKGMTILSQSLLYSGARIFYFTHDVKSVVITEVSYSPTKKQTIESGDFSGMTYVYYGNYEIEIAK